MVKEIPEEHIEKNAQMELGLEIDEPEETPEYNFQSIRRVIREDGSVMTISGVPEGRYGYYNAITGEMTMV